MEKHSNLIETLEVNLTMKRIKTIALLFLAFLIFSGTASTSAQTAKNPYTDVKSKDYFYTAVTSLTADGIIKGQTATKFGVNANATRGETAQYIANALKLDTKNVKNPGFTDVPKTHPYYGAIAALSAKGIINGIGNNKFGPNNTLERYQIAKILSLAFDLEVVKSTKTPFKDIQKLNKDLQSYVNTLVDYEITTGTSATTFAPYKKVLREQLATFIYRTIDATADLEIIGIE